MMFCVRKTKLLIFLTLLSFASEVAALEEDELKKAVFSDCPRVQSLLPTLSAVEKGELISYLGRLLSVPVISLKAPDAAGNPPPTPIGGIRPPGEAWRDIANIWQSFDPKRELEARRCAVELLRKLVPQSFVALPDLLKSGSDPGLSPELRFLVEETAWYITVFTVRNRQNFVGPISATALNFPAELLHRLIPELSGELGYLAGNILVETRPDSLAPLVDAFWTADEKLSVEIVRVLLRLIDISTVASPQFPSPGASIYSSYRPSSFSSVITLHFLPAIGAGDLAKEKKALDLLVQLPASYAELLPRLARTLGGESIDREDLLYGTLSKMLKNEEAFKSLVSDEETLRIFCREFEKTGFSRREVLAKAIEHLARGSSVMEARLLTWTKAPEEDLRRWAYVLAGKLELKSEYLVAALIDGVYEASLPLQLAAIEALGSFREKAVESTIVFLRVLKAKSKEKDPSVSQALLFAVARTVTKLPVIKETKLLVSYFLEALSLPAPVLGTEGSSSSEEKLLSNEFPPVAALVHAGEHATAGAMRLLSRKEVLVKRRAIAVLSRIYPFRPVVVRSIAFMLGDAAAEVRLEARYGLLRMGESVVPEMTRLLGSKNQMLRREGAMLLALLGRSTPSSRELLASMLDGLSCNERLSLAKALAAPETREREQMSLLLCFNAPALNRHELGTVLEELSPLSQRGISRVLEVLRNTSEPRETRFELARLGRGLGVPVSELSKVLLVLLAEAQESEKIVVLKTLADIGPEAGEAIPTIRSFFDNEGLPVLVRLQAAVTLSRIDTTGLQLEDFFVNGLQSEEAKAFQSAFGQLKPEFAIVLLEKLFAKTAEEKRWLLAEVAGVFAVASTPLSGELLKLLSSPVPQNRYSATLALIRCGLQSPETIMGLRRELVGRYRERLLEEPLPASSQALVETILLAPESFVEQQGATRLLVKLRHLTRQ